MSEKIGKCAACKLTLYPSKNGWITRDGFNYCKRGPNAENLHYQTRRQGAITFHVYGRPKDV